MWDLIFAKHELLTPTTHKRRIIREATGCLIDRITVLWP